MTSSTDETSTNGSFRDRVTRQGEEAFGKLAEELLQNPVIHGALTAAFETRERASRAQEVAMTALNLPSASDIERLARRVRSVSQRIEGLEDGVDRVVARLDGAAGIKDLEKRLVAIERTLKRIEKGLQARSDADVGKS